MTPKPMRGLGKKGLAAGAAMLLVLFTGACQTTEEYRSAPEYRFVKQSVASAEAPPPVEAQVVEEARVESVPERVYPEPETLAAMNEEALSELLGPPVFRRRDAPAEIWQYQGPTCVLDLFLYRDGDRGPLTVDHFETRAKGNDVLTDAECLVSIMKTVERAKAG